MAMVQYVMENRCLGVVSGDTDFIVFDGIPHLFLPGDIADLGEQNLRSGKQIDPYVSVYLRCEFIRSINLDSRAFPIFATLLGNDFVDFDRCTVSAYIMATRIFDKELVLFL